LAWSRHREIGIPALAEMVAAGGEDQHAAVVMELCVLKMRQLQLDEIRPLEVSLRSWVVGAWPKQSADQMRWGVLPEEICALYTLHASGYMREAALRELIAREAVVRQLTYFLVRLNDWVPQVRDVAVQAIRPLLGVRWTAEWMGQLSLVSQLEQWSRIDHSWLSRELATLFRHEDNKELLRGLLYSGNHDIARWAFGVATGCEDQRRAALLRDALLSPDGVVKVRAARLVKEWKACPGRGALIEMMARDRHKTVRREALYAMLDVPQVEREASLRRALFDKAAVIREAARFYLRDDAKSRGAVFDVAAEYRRALAMGTEAELPIALVGLGESGSAADVAVLKGYASHPQTRVSAAAVRAVARLDGQNQVEWLLGMLEDARLAVGGAAAREMRASGVKVSPERLRAVATSSRHAPWRRWAVVMLLSPGSLATIPDAIRAACSEDEGVASLGGEYLRRLSRRRPLFVEDPVGVAEVARQLKRSRGRLERALEEAVCSYVGLRESDILAVSGDQRPTE
jgi:HEAT repeat protein